MKQRHSFTLKNIAITLGIIGVVWLVVFSFAGADAASVATITLVLFSLIGVFVT